MLALFLLLLSLLILLVQCAPTSFIKSNTRELADRLDIIPQAVFASTGLALQYNDTINNESTPTSMVLASQPNFSQDSQRSSPLVMAYYPDWTGLTLPPESIECTLFDWIDFAFTYPDENFNLVWDSEGAPLLLSRLVTVMHACGKKVKLSIGGWTGSKYFSSAVATNTSRHAFAYNILDLYRNFRLDGIDIDWEYPGHQGAGGNQVNSLDSANFCLFLQCLRSVLPSDAVITAAAQTIPFSDADGQPTKDASCFTILNWIVIMNYDAWGSLPGPNAPLLDSCKNSTQPGSNAVAAYNKWTSAGFPISKLVLGLPSYGYVSKSNVPTLRQRSTVHTRPTPTIQSRGRNTTTSDPMVKVMDEDGGQVQFRELVEQGALVLTRPADGDKLAVYDAAGGFEKHWDSCSSTPYLYSPSSGQTIAYDDPNSLHMKAEFAREVGMLGINLWDAHGDTKQWDLIYSVRNALGVR